MSPAQLAQPTGSFELEELTVTQLQDAMAAGRYTSSRLVELYTERINEVDRRGPTLRSVIELNPDALVDRGVPGRGAAGGAPCVGRCTASRS